MIAIRSTLALALVLLPLLGVQNFRPRSSGSALCDSFSGLFCEDFENPTDACGSEDTTPTVAGQTSCACTVSTNCLGGTRPPSVPEGNEVVELSNETASDSGDALNWADKVDDADAADTQYGAMDLYVDQGDADEDSYRTLVGFFSGGTSAWTGGGADSEVIIFADLTPTIQAKCTGFNTGAVLNVSLDAWHQLRWSTQESTCIVSVCVDAPIGAPTGCIGAGNPWPCCTGTDSGTGCCSTCDGDSCPTTQVDGFSIENADTTSFGIDDSSRFFDRIRWSTSSIAID